MRTASGQEHPAEKEGPVRIPFDSHDGQLSSLYIPQALYVLSLCDLLSVSDLVGQHHSVNFSSRPRLKTADGAVVQLCADSKLFKLDVPVPPSGRDGSGNAAHGRVPTAAAMSTVPVSSGFTLPSSFGRDERTGNPVARPGLHVFTNAHSAKIAHIAALTDAQLCSAAVDLHGWEFPKKIMPAHLGPLSVSYQDVVRGRLLDAWQLRQAHNIPKDLPVPTVWYVIDVCAGSASVVPVLYHLHADPKARALLIDILPESEMRKLIDPAYHSRISFVSDFDVIDLSVSQLGQLVQDAWGVPLSNLARLKCAMPALSAHI